MSAPSGTFQSSPGIVDHGRRRRRNTRRLVVPSLRVVDAPKGQNLRPDSARTPLEPRGLSSAPPASSSRSLIRG